ncbi:MAG TPA: helix-turn-helix domain-containing protein [Anaerolineae bacterium]|nr:helix-turn-helix domain-containing protein [Anaerolineae bacterium]HMR66068.1 helix-turn-helix domain-containing protein [Anaerolineae bacterium]
MSDLMTVLEAATRLRVSRSTVWRWCREGRFDSAFQIGRTWRIHRGEVDQIVGQPYRIKLLSTPLRSDRPE